MKRLVLISLLAAAVGVMAFLGCERPEPIDPTEGQPQTEAEDSLNQITDRTYGIHGLWKCTDYEELGAYYLNFRRNVENAGILTKENCTLEWRTLFDDSPYYYSLIEDTVLTFYEPTPTTMETIVTNKMLRLDTIGINSMGEPVCRDFGVQYYSFDSIRLWYTGALPTITGPDGPAASIRLKLVNR